MQGVVVHWTGRGFGFIRPDDGSADVYFNRAQVKRAGISLGVGDRVEFELQKFNGKTEACNLRLLS